MSAKQQKGKGSVVNHGAQLSRKEGFWPFDLWDPESPSPEDKPTGSVGDDSGYASIKNYPSVTSGPVGKAKQTPARKRVTKK
jgi:hypothetical protein